MWGFAKLKHRRPSWRRAIVTCRGGLAGAALMMLALPPTAFGAAITDLAVAKNAGNSDDLAAGTEVPYPLYFERRSLVAIESSSPTAFRTRYAFTYGLDRDTSAGGGISLEFSRSNYRLEFNVVAPGAYDLLVTTHFNVELNFFDDGSQQSSIQLTGVSGSQSGGALSGTLSVPGPPGILGRNDTGSFDIDQTSPVATIFGVSDGTPISHRLDFSWLYKCLIDPDSDVCVIRGGLATTLPQLADAGSYPGTPPRAPESDGHFVEVTLISYCGDGVVQADKGETCDLGASNGAAGECCNSNCTLRPGGTVCRGAAGVCDVVETCNGIDGACPTNAKYTTVCRAAAGICDVAEVCDGAGDDCPSDAYESAGVDCRAVAGACDVAESCTGVDIDCPADAKSTAQCRASTDRCDPAEICDGVGDDCPADVLLPDGTDCDDGAFCNATQTCTGGVCGGGVLPCPTTGCDEVIDACAIGGCPVLPRACGTAAKTKLLLKNPSDDNKDKLVWKWSRGTATTPVQLGDPLVDAEYALCFYAGATPTLIQGLSVPAGGGKWATAGSKGFKYSDSSAANGGVSTIILKGGADGKSKALVKGKGTNLPDFDGIIPLLASELPLIVQLRNNANGSCWAGTFADPQQAGQFNGK